MGGGALLQLQTGNISLYLFHWKISHFSAVSQEQAVSGVILQISTSLCRWQARDQSSTLWVQSHMVGVWVVDKMVPKLSWYTLLPFPSPIPLGPSFSSLPCPHLGISGLTGCAPLIFSIWVYLPYPPHTCSLKKQNWPGAGGSYL
jgi:hypothetical protein